MNEKAISVKQPWAYLLCAGIKPIENRTWPLPEKYKGKRVLIHASGSNDKKFKIQLTDEQMIASFGSIANEAINGKFDFGAIIGSVRFVDCVINHPSIWAEKTDICTDGWYKPIYNWVATDPILFDEPILNIKGKLSFWDCSSVIHSDIDEDGKPVCMCNFGIDEKDQVSAFEGKFTCKYCDGKWYK